MILIHKIMSKFGTWYCYDAHLDSPWTWGYHEEPLRFWTFTQYWNKQHTGTLIRMHIVHSSTTHSSEAFLKLQFRRHQNLSQVRGKGCANICRLQICHLQKIHWPKVSLSRSHSDISLAPWCSTVPQAARHPNKPWNFHSSRLSFAKKSFVKWDPLGWLIWVQPACKYAHNNRS